jgi:hypothetical protein
VVKVICVKSVPIILVLAILVFACAAPAALAAKPDNGGSADKSTGKPDTTVKDNGKPDDLVVLGDKANGKPQTDEGAAVKPSKEDKVNQGKLISTTEKVRQEQFKLTHDQLKAMGYHGSMSDFATSFNKAVNGLKAEIRVSLQNESNFTTTVVRNLMERELATIREGLMANITVSDKDVSANVTELVSNETIAPEAEATPEEVAAAVEAEVPFMSEEFKEELVLTAEYGTPEEQQALAEQLDEFATAPEQPVEAPVVDVAEVRETLEQTENPVAPIEEPVTEAVAVPEVAPAEDQPIELTPEEPAAPGEQPAEPTP